MLQAVAVQSVVTNYPKGNGWKGGRGVTGERGESRVGANGSLRRTGELPHKAIPIPAAKPFSPLPTRQAAVSRGSATMARITFNPRY